MTRGIATDTSQAVTQTFSHGYDALGRRIAKTDAFGTTRFAWNGDQLAQEQRGASQTSYLYQPESFVPLAQIHDGALHHIHTDHLGTPLEASNDAGQISWRVTYKTWGNVLVREDVEVQAQAQPIEQRLRFQGQYFDTETGLHYNRFRYYDPGAGRFISQDPIGLLGGPNVYGYGPNPISWIDPNGLSPKCPCNNPCGLALHGEQPSPRPGETQSHHQIQDAWAKANVEGYSRNKAPSILLARDSHSTITAMQNARRDERIAAGNGKWDSSIADEFNNTYRDLGQAGVSEKCRRKAIKYFDNIGGFSK